MAYTISNDVIQQCKIKLLNMKQDLLNRARLSRQEFAANQTNVGDEIDQSSANIEEHAMLTNQERIRTQLFEIEMALGRMERGVFGICEETQEPIELDRLLAIPFTRVSIEGAEIREAFSRKFVRA